MNIKTMMEEIAQEELERDGAACIEVMQIRKSAGTERHGNMRLIDADALMDGEFPEAENEYQMGWNDGLRGAMIAAPTVDAAPVVHGYWTKDDCCSECGADIPSDSRRDFIDESECLYCYSCGAKMDGDGNG